MSHLTCAELVEKVTDLLDGALDAATERQLVEHLCGCGGCDRYLDQFQQTVRALHDARPEWLPDHIREAVLAAARPGRA